MDRIIEVKVNGHHLTKDNNVAGVQHESNATSLRIEFDESWDGYAKKVTFWDAHGCNPVAITLTVDQMENAAVSTRVYVVAIPGEAMTQAGSCTFVIDGYMNWKRIRSISSELKVMPAPDSGEAVDPNDPTPTQAEQLQAQVEAIMGTIQSAIVSAQNAEASALEAETIRNDLEEEGYYPHLSKSYAVGGTGVRDGEDTDNAKYYYEQARKNFVESNGLLVDDTTGEIYRLGVDNGLLYIQEASVINE